MLSSLRHEVLWALCNFTVKQLTAAVRLQQLPDELKEEIYLLFPPEVIPCLPVEWRDDQQLLELKGYASYPQLLACAQLEVPNHCLLFHSRRGDLEEMENAIERGAIDWEQAAAEAADYGQLLAVELLLPELDRLPLAQAVAGGNCQLVELLLKKTWSRFMKQLREGRAQDGEHTAVPGHPLVVCIPSIAFTDEMMPDKEGNYRRVISYAEQLATELEPIAFSNWHCSSPAILRMLGVESIPKQGAFLALTKREKYLRLADPNNKQHARHSTVNDCYDHLLDLGGVPDLPHLLQTAALVGNVSFFQYWLGRTTKPVLEEELFEACTNGHLPIVRLILDAVDSGQAGMLGEQALEQCLGMAIYHRYLKIVQLLANRLPNHVLLKMARKAIDNGGERVAAYLTSVHMQRPVYR